MSHSSHRVHPGQRVRLSAIKPDNTAPFRDKADALKATEENLQRMAVLQNILYAEGRRSLLVVLQGMDTSGKDGTISHVFSGINPQGCSVASFKVPSAGELAHDFLWRIHNQSPARGMIAIFNRSHYESVLVERVHKLVPRKVWEARYQNINDFESMLCDEGTRVIKLFLHISKDEQRERLQARLADPAKNWKLSAADLHERELWDDYQGAYEDALSKCSTENAPWYVIPANRKWFRNWLVSEIIVNTLKDMKPKFPPAPDGIAKWKVK